MEGKLEKAVPIAGKLKQRGRLCEKSTTFEMEGVSWKRLLLPTARLPGPLIIPNQEGTETFEMLLALRKPCFCSSPYHVAVKGATGSLQLED